MHFWWRRGAAALLISGFLLGPGALARPGGQAGGGDLAAATAFQAFWQTHDGARLFGAPLAAPSQENGLTVQYYERARLEWHPSYPAGWQVTLGRLGAELLGARTFPRIAPFPSNPDHRYFAATGHSILGGLLRFWDAEGGLPVFGFPLSEELTEDGRTVQYFERARLEWHPELEAVGYQALATPLGALARQAPAVILEPPVLQEGHTAVIKVVPPPGSTVTGGSLNGNTLAFTCCVPLTAGSSTVAQPWAVAGAESYQSPDSLRLLVSLQGADGSTQQVERTLPVRRYPYPTARTTYYGPRTPQATRTAEHATLDAVFAGRSGPPRWSGRFVLPLHGAPQETSPFGERRAYNDEPPYEIHTGLDLTADYGTPVYAPAPGRVVWAQFLELRGNTVILDHGAGVFTLYAHLSAFRVSLGQPVQTGDRIALAGSTGNATGPHLHWEVHASGPAVQPQEWLARPFP